MAHRVTLKLRDGRVLAGFTPAFDPKDGSLWLSPEANSPAGTMVPLTKVALVLLEPTDRRPVELPASDQPADKSMGIRINFGDGDVLVGRTKANVVGMGVWVQPSGKSFARAFVTDGVSVSVELDEDGDFATDAGMLSLAPPAFSAVPPPLGEPMALEYTPTDEMPALPYGLAREVSGEVRDSLHPTQSMPPVKSERDTMPVEVPRTLVPPPLPGSGPVEAPELSTSAAKTLALPLVDITRTEKDTMPPEGS